MLRLAVLAVILAGCAQVPRPVPSAEALIVVFADDFHSGIVLERSQSPAELLPPDRSTPWTALHYGERRWITGQADGVCDALRLAVCTGQGGVQIDAVDWWVHERGGTDPSTVRIWVFPVATAQVAALRARLDSWVDPGASYRVIRPGSGWWDSRQSWSLSTNCHDFTVDLLAAAGIEVDAQPIMLAAPLRAALDRTWSDLDLAR